MAKYKTSYSNRVKNVTKAIEGTRNVANQNNMANSIQNYQTRLKNVGVDPKAATDTRNIVEKALNLPEGQNALFDIFEIINRPQQALFTGIDNAINGQSFLEGMKEGITGEATTSGSDIFRDLGVSDTELFTNPITKNAVSLSDLLGLGADIFADPLDVPLFAAKPVTMAAKGAKLADTAADVAKVADKSKLVFAPFQKGSKSALELGVGALAKGAKKGVSATGNIIEKGLTKSDSKLITKLAENTGLIEKGTKVSDDMIPELATRLSNMGVDLPNKAEAFKAAKKGLKRTVDYRKSIPDDLYDTIMRSNNAIDSANAYGKQIRNTIKNEAENYAKKVGRNVDDVSSDIQKLISSKYAPETSMADSVMDVMKKGKSTIKGDKKELEVIKKALDDFQKANGITDNILTSKITGNSLSITGNKKLLGSSVVGTDLMEGLSNIKYAKKMTLTDDLAKSIDDLKSLYANDAGFKELVDNAEGSYLKFNDALKGITGETVDFSDMLREGFLENALTDEGGNFLKTLKENNIGVSRKAMNARKSDIILEGNKQLFEGRKYDAIPELANQQFSDDIASAISSRQTKIDYLEAQKHSNVLKSVKENLKINKLDQLNAAQNFNKNIDKLNLKKDVAQNLKKSYDAKFEDLSKLIDDKVMSRAQKVNDPTLINSLSKKVDDYTKKANRVTFLQAQLSSSDLTKTQVKSLSNKLEKALNSQNNTISQLKSQVAKINGAASERYIKNASKLANDMVDRSSELTKKALNQQAKVNNALDKIQQAKTSYNDIAKQLTNQQSELQLQLNKLKGMSAEEIAKADKNILNQIESLQKDIDILSSFEGQKLFSTDFFQGFDEYINKTSKQAKAMKTYNEALLHSGLSNTDVMKIVKKGEKATDITGMTKIDAEKVDKFLDSMKNFIPEDSKLLKEFEQQLKGSKEVYLEKGLAELLDINKGMSREEANAFLKIIDNTNNLFKKTSTLSPGFQVRNVAGNASNMWLSGMSWKDITKAYKKSNQMMKGDYIADLVYKAGEGSLNAAEKADYELAKKFIESGAFGSGKDIRDLGELIEKATANNESKTAIKKAWDKIFSINAELNQKMDNRSRMALLSYATDNPQYVQKLGEKDAIDAMHYVLFDPQNLSPFEKQYMKRLIPFYTFTKQNLMFQAKNVLTNTSRYNRLMRTYNKLYDAVGEGNYRQYQKENFELPIFMGDNGLTTVKANLPLSDLGEYMSNPLQRLVSSTNPLIKTPFEQVTGVDTFTGRDISDRSLLDAILGTTGLSKLTTDQFSKASAFANGNVTGENALATLLPSVFRYSDTEKIANQEQYEELMQYQDMVKQLKNQGIDVPGIKELTDTTSSTIKAIKKIRDKKNKRRYN